MQAEVIDELLKLIEALDTAVVASNRLIRRRLLEAV